MLQRTGGGWEWTGEQSGFKWYIPNYLPGLSPGEEWSSAQLCCLSGCHLPSPGSPQSCTATEEMVPLDLSGPHVLHHYTVWSSAPASHLLILSSNRLHVDISLQAHSKLAFGLCLDDASLASVVHSFKVDLQTQSLLLEISLEDTWANWWLQIKKWRLPQPLCWPNGEV